MNYLELNNREVELVPTAQPLQNRHPRCPRSEGELNQQRDLFLNDSLRSANSSINGDDSQASIGDPDDSQEGEALLDQRHYPNPNIAALYRVLYDYLRFGLAAFFFLYSFYLLFSAQGQCYNGSGSLKKLPKISRSRSIRMRHVRNQPYRPQNYLQRSASPRPGPIHRVGFAELAAPKTHDPAPGDPCRLDSLCN